MKIQAMGLYVRDDGEELEMTREQVYEMTIEELEYVSEIFNEQQ